MNGFITESTSKISDGFGTAIKLLAAFFITKCSFYLFELIAGQFGIFLGGFLLLGFGGYLLVRAVSSKMEDSSQLWFSMAAAVFLWQALNRLIPKNRIEPLLFVLLVLFSALIWKKVNNHAVHIFLLTFILHWIGSLFSPGGFILASLPKSIVNILPLCRYIGIIGIPLAGWWIITKSRTIVERNYAAMVLYFSFV